MASAVLWGSLSTVTGSISGDGATEAHVVQNPDGSVFVVSAPPPPEPVARRAAEASKAAERAQQLLEAQINASGYLVITDEDSHDIASPVHDPRDLRLQAVLAEQDRQDKRAVWEERDRRLQAVLAEQDARTLAAINGGSRQPQAASQ